MEGDTSGQQSVSKDLAHHQDTPQFTCCDRGLYSVNDNKKDAVVAAEM